MTMKISISPNAKTLIEKKTNEIILKKEVTRSWAGTFIKPAVHAGKPENPEDYSVFEVEGITVYMPKDEGTERDIKIDVKGLGPFKQFVIEGF